MTALVTTLLALSVLLFPVGSAAALMLPSAVKQRARLGAELPATMTPAQTRAFVSAERDKYAAIVKGIKFE